FQSFLILMLPRTPTPTLFPYTTLFRSVRRPRKVRRDAPPRADAHVGIARHAAQQSRAARIAREARCVCRGRVPHRDGLSAGSRRSEEHTSELQSRGHLVCRLLLEKKNK